MAEEENQRILRCAHCNKTFHRRRHIEKHLEGHEANNCHLCDTLMSTRKQLELHMVKTHNIVLRLKNVQCKYCDKCFVKKKQLYYHYKKEHAGSLTVCFKCGIFLKPEEVKPHQDNHYEQGPWKCKICEPNEIFSRKQQYLFHIKAHDKYKCKDCDLTFATKAKLFRHNRVIHRNCLEEEVHICDCCGMKFSRPWLLNQHCRIHTGEKPFSCKGCNKQFISSKGYKNHFKLAAHQENNREQLKVGVKNAELKCEKCDKSFCSKEKLVNHLEKPHSFNCEFCSYVSCSRKNTKRHIALHTESRQFICEHCGTAFFSMSNLQDHCQYMHSNDRSFQCQHCSSAFKTNSALKRHLQTHSDSRPYGCHCGQTYKRISHLHRHQHSSHGPTKSKKLQRLQRDKSGALVPINEVKKPKTGSKLKTDGKPQAQLTSDSTGTPVLSLFVADSGHIFTLQQACSTDMPEATMHHTEVDSYETELLQTMQVSYDQQLTSGVANRDSQLVFNSVETVEEQYAHIQLHGDVEQSLLDESFFTSHDHRAVAHYQQNEINVTPDQSFLMLGMELGRLEG